MYLDAPPNEGLRPILGQARRVDKLFIDRSVSNIADRLHILASDEKKHEMVKVDPKAVHQMMEILALLYNYVIIDLPSNDSPLTAALTEIVNHRILIMDPSLISLRESLKIVENGTRGVYESQAPTVLLNRSGQKGGLDANHIRSVGNLRVDVDIPEIQGGLLQWLNAGKMPPENQKAFGSAISLLSREIGAVPNEVRVSGAKVSSKSFLNRLSFGPSRKI
jgi:pilus assembly protein CpaE